MTYTVHKLAKLAGISVRTLHYYDEIGLLKPSFSRANGYRYYEEKELLKLQQILFFRELDFSLEQIKLMMHAPGFDTVAALEDQRKLLVVKKERTEKLLQTIHKTIETMKGGEYMSTDDTFSAFNDPTYQKYKDEVKERWGKTDAYKQSMERVGKMTKEDFERVKKEGGDISRKTADLMKQGFSFDSPEVQEQIDRFYTYLRHFYEPNYGMFQGLGQMYVDDPRFTKTYEKIGKGLAVFMRDAMKHYAQQRIKK